MRNAVQEYPEARAVYCTRTENKVLYLRIARSHLKLDELKTSSAVSIVVVLESFINFTSSHVNAVQILVLGI